MKPGEGGNLGRLSRCPHHFWSMAKLWLRIILTALAVTYGPLGVAASQAAIYRQSRSKQPTLYNPVGYELQHHCFFACVLFAAGLKQPCSSDVNNLRQEVAALWASQPHRLRAAASRLNLTPWQYCEQISGSLWGGSPDMSIVAEALGLSVRIVNGAGNILWQTHAGPVEVVLQLHRRHYQVLAARRWKRKPTNVRSWYTKKIRRAARSSPNARAATAAWEATHHSAGRCTQARGGVCGLQSAERRGSTRSRSPQRAQSSLEANFKEWHADWCIRAGGQVWCVVCADPLTGDHICQDRHQELYADWQSLPRERERAIVMLLRCRRYLRDQWRLPHGHMEREWLLEHQERREMAGQDKDARADELRGGMQALQEDPERSGTPGTSSTEQGSTEPKAEPSSQEEDEQDDEALALALQQQIDSSTVDGGGDWWVVICTYSTRVMSAEMQPGTRLVHLAAAIALALKWQTSDVVLQAEGCTLMLQGNLGQTSPPYMIEVYKRQVIPSAPKRRPRQKREKVEMDLGKIHGDADPPLAYPHVCSSSGLLGSGTGASSSSGEPPCSHDTSHEAWRMPP